MGSKAARGSEEGSRVRSWEGAREGWSVLCPLGPAGSGCAGGAGKMGTKGELAAPTRPQGSCGWEAGVLRGCLGSMLPGRRKWQRELLLGHLARGARRPIIMYQAMGLSGGSGLNAGD